MKDEISTLNYYDAIARGYKNLYHEEQIQKISKVIEFLPVEGIFLDLGSGDGVINQFIAKDVNLISLDLSFELLKLNSSNKKIQSLAQNIPLKDDSIDFISSFTVFQDINEPAKAINESKRVLKKNGIFILSFLKISSKAQLIIKHLKKEFEIVKKFEEEKDYIFILKNSFK